jgi:guanylate kinase
MKNGLLVIISSPSGGGKDSVIRELLKIFSESARLVTTTSRLPRPGNEEGIDYFFISREKFLDKKTNNEFVETNEYAGNFYGLEKKHLIDTLVTHNVVFTQIEVHGKHNLDKAGIPSLSIFLLPESLEILGERIRKRGGVTEEKIAERLAIAKSEIEQSVDYDFRIINVEGKFSETVAKISEIIRHKLGEE